MKSTDGDASSSAGPDNLMVVQWKKRNTANLKRIHRSCDNNPELQLIVIGEIEKFEKIKAAAVQKGGGEGASMASIMALAIKKKDKVVNDWDVVPPGELERWMWSYKKWGPAAVKAVILYCDESLRETEESKFWTSKDETLKALEYAFDLQVLAPDGDYVASSDRVELFVMMKEAYIGKGRRLSTLINDIAQNSVDWNKLIYSITEADIEGKMTPCINNKVLNQTKPIPVDVLGSLDWKTFKFFKNWSVTMAEMHTGKDEILCSGFSRR